MAVSAPTRIHSRNATFQQWESLLTNRTKRHRHGQFLVQGVRPITLAIEAGWELVALIRPDGGGRSRWAAQVWDEARCQRVEMPAEMVRELGERSQDAPELVAVVAMPPDDLDRLVDREQLLVVFDRPTQPGNIGTLQRSMDAFGAGGLIVTGHAADPYDPKAVRASTGSCFNLPTVRIDSTAAVLDWLRTRPQVWQLLATDEGGESDLRAVDLAAPTLLVIGNETRGISQAWREACDQIISIPMVGGASSLNAAVAGSIVLHEALRQRRG
ncbi:rRNA methyltransferase [Yimella sp. cx-51]|nr:TrmH family RNA methyltransferase [Yimella sp. cx-51]QTH37613.1 rRNA methyltransferase [Yimella sp. cx-51]